MSTSDEEEQQISLLFARGLRAVASLALPGCSVKMVGMVLREQPVARYCAGMSEENVEVVLRGYDAYNRGDLKAFGELLASDAIAHPLPYWPEAGARHGREEILALLAEIREPLERNEAAPEKIVDGDDHVVTAHLWRGALKGTKDEIEARVGMLVTLRAGKVAELRWFRTFDEALEAVGLSE